MIAAVLLLLMGAPQGVPLRGDVLDQRTQEIASGLRCPVCQGLSIADSPSEMAVNMKAEVRSMLERGYTREQIETYFVRSYGEFVLLEPRTPVIWILPVVALIAGIAIMVVTLRRLAASPRTRKIDPDAARVRSLVKGTNS